MEASTFYGTSTPKSRLAVRIENEVEAKRKRARDNQINPREPYIPCDPDDSEKFDAYRRFDLSISHLLRSIIIWKTFLKQADALDLARNDSVLHVFAFENDHGDGKRRFLATSYEQFFFVYIRVAPAQRFHYEVIPECCPVKLFFDLEYEREFNPKKDDDALVDCIILETFSFLRSSFPDRFTENFEEEVLKLEASTEKKFSQHLIFPNVYFGDRTQLGGFVHRLYDRIFEKSEADPSSEIKQLLVRKTDGKTVLPIDKGVYTKNRNFRLYLSRKQGKDNPLLLTLDSQFHDREPREIFLLSLICNVDCPPKNLLSFEPVTKRTSVNASFDEDASHSPNAKAGSSLPATFASGAAYGPTPYPNIDEFFHGFVNSDGMRSYIRTWRYFPDAEMILYNIAGDYRFCENVGRHHKSNGVFFVAYISEGVYYQKCFDPDCQSFRSRAYSLPYKKEEATDLPDRAVEEDAGPDAPALISEREEDEDSFIALVPMHEDNDAPQ